MGGTKLRCGCVPDASGFGWCSDCRLALRKRIWREMGEDRKQYDRTFDPAGSYYLDRLCSEEDASEEGVEDK